MWVNTNFITFRKLHHLFSSIFRPASPRPSASAIIGDGTPSFLTKETTKIELYLNKRVEQAINYSILDMNTTPKRYRKIHSNYLIDDMFGI